MSAVITEEQKRYMRRAVVLALKGKGAVNPNPLVGAVIVKNGHIIGEGYHEKYGELHAERNALASLTEDAAGADLYVTLEPCCHHGKQPPCTDAIIEAGIKRVFVGSDDPNALVAGKGYQQLRKAGVEVIPHVLKEECDSINDVFFHYIVNQTPYVVMKYAMTLDGKIATITGESQWITGEAARAHVMEQRNQLTGIMVGIGTVSADDPMLTCRMSGGRNPVRIICDSHLRIPLTCNLVRTARQIPTIVATISKDMERMQALLHEGVEILRTDAYDGHVDLQDLMKKLGERKIDGILLEGGSRLNYSAVTQGIVQEIDVYIAPKIFGGESVFTPVAGIGILHPDEAYRFRYTGMEVYGEDILLRYRAL